VIRAGLAYLDRGVVAALHAWVIAGILLRVTRVRDSWDRLVPIFYSTPWPVVAAAFAVLALRARLLGKGRACRCYMLLTGGAFCTWVATSFYFARPDAAGESSLRLVHWNVARPDAMLPRATAWLRSQDADVICIAEAQPKRKNTLPRWRAAFPDYEMQLAAGEMICLVRGEIIGSVSGSLTPGSYYALHRLRVRGRTVNVMQVDNDANPRRSRRGAIDSMMRIARQEADGNLIIAGDFNLPRESALLDPLRHDFSQSFEAAGRGFAETWPSPVVALSLDQIWAGRLWRPISARHGWSFISDHRPVVVDFTPR
jgi:endonuclease/exonuclease/phosphatase (EEP) superfamily protein YafD